MLMSANDPASPLTQEERAKIHSLEKMSNQNLSGIVDGAISLNDLSTLKGRSKIICYPAGEQLSVQKFSDDLADYYDHIEPSKKTIIASQRLGYFATAFLIKSYPCQWLPSALLLLKRDCVAALLRLSDRHSLCIVSVAVDAYPGVVCLPFITENQGYLSGIRQGWHDPQRQHQ